MKSSFAELPGYRNGRVYFYFLLDPRNGEVRYVGISNDCRQRASKHLNGTQAQSQPQLSSWISELRCLGLKPIFQVVATMKFTKKSLWAKAVAEAAERRLIEWMNYRTNLVNMNGTGKRRSQRNAKSPA